MEPELKGRCNVTEIHFAERVPWSENTISDKDFGMVVQPQGSASENTQSTQGRSEADITPVVAQANRKSKGKDNSKGKKKSAAGEAVEAAGKELHAQY